MPTPETYKLPSQQLPEAAPTATPINLDPNLPTWDQLTAQLPPGMVGLEWTDQFGNTRRVSHYDVVSRPHWEDTHLGRPKLNLNESIQGGMYLGRDRQFTQRFKDYEHWTVDVIDRNGNLKEVLEYGSYDYQTRRQPLKFFSSTPTKEDRTRRGRAKRRENRRRLREERANNLKEHVVQTHHRNTLQEDLNLLTGFDERGVAEPAFPVRIGNFRRRELPKPNKEDLMTIPVDTRGPANLDHIRRAALRLGRKDLEGLEWTDKSGNTKRILRQYSAEHRIDHGKHQHGPKVPEVYYLIKTEGIAAKGPVRVAGDTPDHIIEDLLGTKEEPIQIFDAGMLDEHFKQRVNSRFPLNLRLAIPRLRDDERQDVPLIAEEVDSLWRANNLGHAPFTVLQWLGRRLLDGTGAPNEALTGDDIDFQDAILLLNTSERIPAYDPKRSAVLHELYRDPNEAKYARHLQNITKQFGVDKVLEIAASITDGARISMKQLGLEKLRPEREDVSKALRNLVMSHYYGEHPDEIEDDEFTLTPGNPFKYDVTGQQVLRDAFDHLVGAAFFRGALIRKELELSATRQVTSAPSPIGHMGQVTAEEAVKRVSYEPNYVLIGRLSESDKATKEEIDHLVTIAAHNAGWLPDIAIARVGRLLNQLVGN